MRDTRKNECTKNNEVRCFDSTKQFTRIMLITQGLVLRQKCALLPLLYHQGEALIRRIVKALTGCYSKGALLAFFTLRKKTPVERESLFSCAAIALLGFRFQRAKNQSVTFFISFDEKRCQEACKQGSSQESWSC